MTQIQHEMAAKLGDLAHAMAPEQPGAKARAYHRTYTVVSGAWRNCACGDCRRVRRIVQG